jgi:hypothetical protein
MSAITACSNQLTSYPSSIKSVRFSHVFSDESYPSHLMWNSTPSYWVGQLSKRHRSEMSDSREREYYCVTCWGSRLRIKIRQDARDTQRTRRKQYTAGKKPRAVHPAQISCSGCNIVGQPIQPYSPLHAKRGFLRWNTILLHQSSTFFWFV